MRKSEGITEVDGLSIDNADFSHASLPHFRISNSRFTNCIFDRADMTNMADLGNHFENCRFVGTDMRAAILGLRHSVYRDCLFEKVRFARTGFVNAIFEGVTFRGDLRRINFKVSGFWGCRFIGNLWDVMFFGESFFDSQQNEIFGVPRDTGLHNVSFEDAKLQFVNFRWNCAVEHILLPRDGSSVLCTKIIYEEFERDAQKNPPIANIEALKKALYLHSIWYEKQDILMIHEADLIDICGDEDGRRVYSLLRDRVVSSAGAIAATARTGRMN